MFSCRTGVDSALNSIIQLTIARLTPRLQYKPNTTELPLQAGWLLQEYLA